MEMLKEEELGSGYREKLNETDEPIFARPMESLDGCGDDAMLSAHEEAASGDTGAMDFCHVPKIKIR